MVGVNTYKCYVFRKEGVQYKLSTNNCLLQNVYVTCRIIYLMQDQLSFSPVCCYM